MGWRWASCCSRSPSSADLTVAEREAQHEGLTRATQDARFRSLVQHSSEALVVVDRAGTVSYASPSTPGVLGIEVQDAVGAKVAEIPAFAQAPDLLAALASPTRGAIVRWTVAAGASRRSLETVVTDLRRDPLVASLVLNTRDVSVRTRLESQLLQKQKLDALGLLAGGVAHDFNNLLMTIRANVDLALESGSPETAEELDEIGRAVEHGASLCRQMLTFSRSDPDPRVSLDLAELLGRVAPMLRRVVPRTIDLVVTPGPAVPIQTSAAGLEIALLNLVMNARDAMPAGGTLTIATSRVDVEPGDDWARDGVPCAAYAVVSVTDTGIGMDDATRVRVFEPFFTTKPLGQGTGIGLSTVHAIVTASEGHVRMSSTWGAGTTATLLFPISTATPEAPHVSEVHAPGPPRHGRILLVEDEVSVRTAMARRLEREGFEIVQAGDGHQALQQLEQDAWRFDAIVTDLTMPGMNGLDLAARVRQSRRDLPIALMSGYTLGSAELRQVSIPPDVLQLTKPFKLTVLVEWLRLRLRQRGEP